MENYLMKKEQDVFEVILRSNIFLQQGRENTKQVFEVIESIKQYNLLQTLKNKFEIDITKFDFIFVKFNIFKEYSFFNQHHNINTVLPYYYIEKSTYDNVLLELKKEFYYVEKIYKINSKVYLLILDNVGYITILI